MYVYIYIYTHTYAYRYMCKYTPACMYTCTHKAVDVYIHVHSIYIYICIRICDMSVCGYMILIWCSVVWHSGTDELFQQWNDLSKRDKLLHDFVHRCWRPDQDHVQNKAGSKP